MAARLRHGRIRSNWKYARYTSLEGEKFVKCWMNRCSIYWERNLEGFGRHNKKRALLIAYLLHVTQWNKSNLNGCSPELNWTESSWTTTRILRVRVWSFANLSNSGQTNGFLMSLEHVSTAATTISSPPPSFFHLSKASSSLLLPCSLPTNLFSLS